MNPVMDLPVAATTPDPRRQPAPPQTTARFNGIILFDGECNLCSGAVRFVIRYDPDGRFMFAALQTEAGKELRQAYRVGADVDSIILISGNQAYTQSEAALRIARGLTGLWPLLWAFIIIPPPLRDGVYRIIARNRYRWFGRRPTCMIPTAAQRTRFL